MTYIQISHLQLLAAAGLMGCNLLLSFFLGLDLERRLLVASLRMVVQLLLVGYILKWVFALDNPVWILGLALAMAGVASLSAVRRTRRRFARIYWKSFLVVVSGSFLVTGFGILGVIRVEPWYDPQYLFPLLGMVLGNTINGISLSVDRFMEDVALRRHQIETLLALGATRWEAAHDSLKESARSGMIPTINSMMIMGIVSLPGMMTGQILAGADPVDAVHYQIVIVFMIAAAAALGVIGVLMLAFLGLFTARHQLKGQGLQRLG